MEPVQSYVTSNISLDVGADKDVQRKINNARTVVTVDLSRDRLR